jgi:hypothetical protein
MIVYYVLYYDFLCICELPLPNLNPKLSFVFFFNDYVSVTPLSVLGIYKCKYSLKPPHRLFSSFFEFCHFCVWYNLKKLISFYVHKVGLLRFWPLGYSPWSWNELPTSSHIPYMHKFKSVEVFNLVNVIS